MSRRNYTDITIVIVILFFDVLIYKYQGVNCSNVILPRSCPLGSSPSRSPEKSGQVVSSETPVLHFAGEKFN
jgi:hypothetical protein